MYAEAHRDAQLTLQRLADEGKLRDWRSLANRYQDQTFKPTLFNVTIAMRHDPEWLDGRGKSIIALNDFRGFPVVRGILPWERSRVQAWEDVEYREWTSIDDSNATIWVQGPSREIPAGSNVVSEAIETIAAENVFHPVREWLRELPKWDGKPYLDRLLADYAGAEDTLINQIFGRKWCIGAVARVMRPGCKMDCALVLEGLQGIGKSTWFKILASAEFFTDQISDFGTKDSALVMQGKWLIELAELDAIGPGETSRIQALYRADGRSVPSAVWYVGSSRAIGRWYFAAQPTTPNICAIQRVVVASGQRSVGALICRLLNGIVCRFGPKPSIASMLGNIGGLTTSKRFRLPRFNNRWNINRTFTRTDYRMATKAVSRKIALPFQRFS